MDPELIVPTHGTLPIVSHGYLPGVSSSLGLVWDVIEKVRNVDDESREKDDEDDEKSGEFGGSDGENNKEVSVNGDSNYNPDAGKLEEEEHWKDDKAINCGKPETGHQRRKGLFG